MNSFDASDITPKALTIVCMLLGAWFFYMERKVLCGFFLSMALLIWYVPTLPETAQNYMYALVTSHSH